MRFSDIERVSENDGCLTCLSHGLVKKFAELFVIDRWRLRQVTCESACVGESMRVKISQDMQRIFGSVLHNMFRSFCACMYSVQVHM